MVLVLQNRYRVLLAWEQIKAFCADYLYDYSLQLTKETLPSWLTEALDHTTYKLYKSHADQLWHSDPRAAIHWILCNASDTYGADSRSHAHKQLQSYIKAPRKPCKPGIIFRTKRLFEQSCRLLLLDSSPLRVRLWQSGLWRINSFVPFHIPTLASKSNFTVNQCGLPSVLLYHAEKVHTCRSMTQTWTLQHRRGVFKGGFDESRHQDNRGVKVLLSS